MKKIKFLKNKILNRKFYQFAHGFYYGDGLGNLGIVLDRIYKKKGYNTKLICLDYDKKLSDNIILLNEFDKSVLKKNDIAVLHYTCDSLINEFVTELKCEKWFYYHNVTPAEYFEKFNKSIAENCRTAREKLGQYKNKFDRILTPSEFNAEELRKLGYSNIEVEPLPKDFSMLDIEPDKNFIKKFNDDFINIIFVGRIVPNKNYDKLINFFSYLKQYKKNIRLLLPGFYEKSYYDYLQQIIFKYQIDDIHFFGRIEQSKLNALYKVSDVFLCLSEHEGYCMPLIEAKYFSIPIIALNKGAVKTTLCNSGILIDELDFKLIKDSVFSILENQK
jgi:glycosyltransferase involved in cell wall biosynthesis